jgi:hypothetical protein
MGLDTLLGPEETDRLGGHHRRVMTSRFARFSLRRGWVPLLLVCGTGLPSHRLISPSWGVWVSGDGSGLVAVCCLRFA